MKSVEVAYFKNIQPEAGMKKALRMCCGELPGTGGDRSPIENVSWVQVSWVLLCMDCEGVFVLWAEWLEYGKGKIMAIKKNINISLLTATA